VSPRILARTARPGGQSARAIHQAASLLLGYPGEDWPHLREGVAAALRPLPGAAEPLRQFCAAVAPVPTLELAARYVRTFDRSRRRTLHLTYYTDGDTRRRGASLAALKALYREHGWRPPDDELPDHLPMVLEFAARCPGPGRRLLREQRAALGLLHAALDRCNSPYRQVLAAVRATLPAADAADRAGLLRLGRAGPPAESVGLLPFTPAPTAPQEGTRR
jgi:nitrate reductase molybdenum cofactor assembly chaperone NarJ/NarW